MNLLDESSRTNGSEPDLQKTRMKITRHAVAMFSSTTIGSLVANESPAAPPENQWGCTLGFSTYGLPKQSLEQAMEVITGTGYGTIEICITPDRDAAAENMNYKRRRDVRRYLSMLRLELTSFMSNYRPLDSVERHQSDLERLKRDCDMAHDLSSGKPPIIQTVLGGKDWEDSKDLCVERVADWVDIAERREAVIAVKPHRGHAMSRPSEAAWLISRLGNPKQLLE